MADLGEVIDRLAQGSACNSPLWGLGVYPRCSAKKRIVVEEGASYGWTGNRNRRASLSLVCEEGEGMCPLGSLGGWLLAWAWAAHDGGGVSATLLGASQWGPTMELSGCLKRLVDG